VILKGLMFNFTGILLKGFSFFMIFQRFIFFWVFLIIFHLSFLPLAQGASGELDITFDPIGLDGKVTTDFAGGNDIAYAVAIQPDGKIVVAGSASIGNLDFALVRYNIDGSLDTTFDSDGHVTTDFSGGADEARAIAIQPDGKIVVAGSASIGNLDFALVRYNIDGSLDTTFDSDGRVTTDFSGGADEARAIAIQPDGKIVVAGSASIGNLDFALVRYNIDGSLDTTFDSDGRVTTDFSGGADEARAIAIQTDGKIVVAGKAQFGTNEFGLVRYNTDGSLDTSFDSDGIVSADISGVNNEAHAVAIQPDGKILAGGLVRFTGNDDFALIRFEGDGTQIDEAFSNTIDSGGKIIAVGRSISSGFYDFALARYNTDGSLDTTFDPIGLDGKVTTGFNGNHDEAYAVAIQADGKIVAAGRTVVNGFYDFALARYNTDGSLDTTFDPIGLDGKVTTGFNGNHDEAYAVAIQADGKIVAAGRSSSSPFDFALARYISTGGLDSGFNSTGKVTTDFGSTSSSSGGGGGGGGGCVMNPKGGIDIALMGILAWGAIFLVRKKILKYISNFSNR